MFNRRFTPYDSLFEGQRTFSKSLLLLGAALMALAALIFMFPELIAFLFAGFILFAGVSILLAGARAYRSKQWTAESPLPYASFEERRTPRYRRTFTYIVR